MKTGFPIEFSVYLHGQETKAVLLSIENSNGQQLFDVRFEDGYRDRFYRTDITKGLNEIDSLYYGVALHHELPALGMLTGKTAIKNFQFGTAAAFANAWIIRELRPENFYYTVYLQGDYLFNLFCTDKQWAVQIQDKIFYEGFDNPLVDRVIQEIGVEPVIEDPALVPATLEFPLLFDYKGELVTAKALLIEASPQAHCYVAVHEKGTMNTNVFQYLRVNAKDKVFHWERSGNKKDKLAAVIAAALEKRFKAPAFSTN